MFFSKISTCPFGKYFANQLVQKQYLLIMDERTSVKIFTGYNKSHLYLNVPGVFEPALCVPSEFMFHAKVFFFKSLNYFATVSTLALESLIVAITVTFVLFNEQVKPRLSNLTF